MNITNTILIHAREIHQSTIDIRRDIHAHPELGFGVKRTANIVARELKKHGIETKEGVGKTGVIGDITVSGATKRIALRADMDALPMQELNETSYTSQNAGAAHMCGHDAHTAMLLGAAQIIKKLKHQLKVNVRFIFQPSEEAHPGGAPEMIKDGALKNVDEIYGLHVYPLISAGKIAIGSPGPFFGASDRFVISIVGKGGHAAFPHLADDLVVMASQFVSTLQSVVSREISPTNPTVVSVTMLNAGTAHNVLPSSVEIKGSVRTLDVSTQTFIKERISKLLDNIVTSKTSSYEFSYTEGYPPVMNGEFPTERLLASARKVVGEENIIFPHPALLAGEDFAYYTQEIPACFYLLGVGNHEKDFNNMIHHPNFDLDESAMIQGVAMHAAVALG